MNTKHTSSLKKFTTYLALFFFLIFVGEILNTIYNKPSYLIRFFLQKTQTHAQKNQPLKSATYLKLATKYQLHQSKKQNPSLKTYPTFPKLNDQQLKTYQKIVQEKTYENLVENYHNLLPRLLYELGLSYYPQNPSLTEEFFSLAVFSAPRWIPFQLELTNLYLHQQNPQKARNQLAFCSNFETVENSCKDYLEQAIEKKDPKNVGFMQEKIAKDIK